MIRGYLYLHYTLSLVVLATIDFTLVNGQAGLCRKVPLKRVMQANGHLQDYCEYKDGANRMILFPGSEFTKHCSLCKCSFTGLKCCQISKTPKPESIPLGCIAILDGCMYRTVLAGDKKSDCYVGLISKMKSNLIKNQSKTAKKLLQSGVKKRQNTQNQKPPKSIQYQISTRKNEVKPTTKPPEPIKAQGLLSKMNSQSKPANKLPQTGDIKKRQNTQKQKPQESIKIQISKKKNEVKLTIKTPKQIKVQYVAKNYDVKNSNRNSLTKGTKINSVQPFELSSILNGKDTFLVISLKNKISERSKPRNEKQSNKEEQNSESTKQSESKQSEAQHKVNQQNESNQSEAQHKANQQSESNQSEAQQELMNKLQKSLYGEYDFTIMDYYNMFNHYNQQAGGTTIPSTTIPNSLTESNHVNVLAIKSSDRGFMKWLIDTLGSLGLINSGKPNNSTTNNHHNKLEMVLKKLVDIETEQFTTPTVPHDAENKQNNSPSYSVRHPVDNHIHGINKHDIVPHNNLQATDNSRTTTTTVHTPSGIRMKTGIQSDIHNNADNGNNASSDLKSTLDSVFDKLLQEALTKKNKNYNDPVTSSPETTVMSKSRIKTTTPSSGGVFGTLEFHHLLGMGLFEHVSK